MITPLKPACATERWPTKPELVEMLERSVSEWNRWRAQHPEIEHIDLCGVSLRGRNLTSANLSFVELKAADLRGACLSKANLYLADLEEANLSGTEFSGAHTFCCKFLPPKIRLQLISALIESWEYVALL